METVDSSRSPQRHNQDVDTDFKIPSLPKPRDKYFVQTETKPNRPGSWDSTLVHVFRRTPNVANHEKVASYLRNYAMLNTFEPFRQGEREFALISSDYTQTSVLDLASGDIIATETVTGQNQNGFCPAGFYVPDWWDINDGSIRPGSNLWTPSDEWPSGNFGFVWGCLWGG